MYIGVGAGGPVAENKISALKTTHQEQTFVQVSKAMTYPCLIRKVVSFRQRRIYHLISTAITFQYLFYQFIILFLSFINETDFHQLDLSNIMVQPL